MIIAVFFEWLLYIRHCALFNFHKNPVKIYYWLFHCTAEENWGSDWGEKHPGPYFPPALPYFSVASHQHNLSGAGRQGSQGDMVCRTQLLVVQSKAEEFQGLDLRPNRMTDKKSLLIWQSKECDPTETPQHLIQKFPSALTVFIR